MPDKKCGAYRTLPETPGVYLMKDARGRILYVGKAANLRRRVSSYFERPGGIRQGYGAPRHDSRIERMVEAVRSIGYERTDTAIEALIREAELIKKLQPPYNIREKDDTSFLYIEITKEEFPRVLLVRGKDPAHGRRFGPFTASSQAREALRIIRRIFPFHTHPPEELRRTRGSSGGRSCFNYGIGLCPGICAGVMSKADYLRTVQNIIKLLSGKKREIVRSLERDMKRWSKALEFEKAAAARRQLFAFRHVQDVALITEDEGLRAAGHARSNRIEGYDISNISGESAVGSMVVFVDGKPARGEYRKFRIRGDGFGRRFIRRSLSGSGNPSEGGDTAMMSEVLARRFGNAWPHPDLVLVDGGKPQVHAAEHVLRMLKLRIPVAGLAKGPERKRNDVHGEIPIWTDLPTLIRVRDEAHRFAITYHKAVRKRAFIPEG